MKQLTTIGLLIAVALTAIGCSSTPQAAAPSSQATPDESGIIYREVDGEKLGLDVCLPEPSDEPAPAVILLHGGGFVEGNRSSSGMAGVCTWLASNGYAAFPVSYRLVPTYTYPSQIEDVAAAVEFLRTNADRFGINPARIGALGSSAGAIIALQAATAGEGAIEAGSRLVAVVSLSGVGDMSPEAVNLGEPSKEAMALMLAYLGCTDITTCEGAAASPITNLDPSDPPTLLVTSKHDLVPVEQAEALDAALATQGVAHELIVLNGSGHGAALMTDGVEQSILEFLGSAL